MSFPTAADENRDEAKEAVEKAILALSKIVIARAEGWDEYYDWYSENLQASLTMLLEVRELLGSRKKARDGK